MLACRKYSNLLLPIWNNTYNKVMLGLSVNECYWKLLLITYGGQNKLECLSLFNFKVGQIFARMVRAYSSAAHYGTFALLQNIRVSWKIVMYKHSSLLFPTNKGYEKSFKTLGPRVGIIFLVSSLKYD